MFSEKNLKARWRPVFLCIMALVIGSCTLQCSVIKNEDGPEETQKGVGWRRMFGYLGFVCLANSQEYTA